MKLLPSPPNAGSTTPLLILVGVTIGTGIGGGISGMVLALVLHFIQHVAYGYSLNAVISPESFLQGVTAAAPARRVLALLICGVVAGAGWWAVFRLGRPLVSISKAIKADDPRMPVITTMAHALLQIITVGLGSPLGREVAPREAAAAFAGWLSHRAGLTAQECRVMVACGAGAGLAAVYNVPLGGALFVLEVLMGTFTASVAIPALVTSVIAAVVSWIGLGDEAQYTVPHFSISYGLVIWSIVMGPVLGFLAYWFSRAAAAARAQAPRGWLLLPCCVLALGVLGVFAIRYPQLLGNGKGPIQLGFDNDLGVPLAAVLLLLKLLAAVGVLRAGAKGGLLTPGMTLGALVAIVTGGLWNLVCPAVPLGAFAVVGAAGFLASSMKMPITTIALVAEFTRLDHDFLVPVLFVVAGSAAALRLCVRRYDASPLVEDRVMAPAVLADSDHPVPAT
jgi:H+/Cl- antiporter ClcA